MRGGRIGRWGVAMLVGLGLQAPLAAGEPAAESTPAAKNADGGSWFGSWFGGREKPAPKKTAPAADKAKKDEAAGASSMFEENTAARAREQVILLRRLAVCDQLRAIAARKQDDALMRQADALDERCWNTYTKRIAHLPAGWAVVEPGAKDGGAPARAEEPVREVSAKSRGK